MADWRQAFTELVDTRGPALVRYARLLCGDDARAADLVQEGLLRVFRRARVSGDLEKLEAYVRRAILNRYLDEHRRERLWRSKRHLVATTDITASTADASATADLVRTALAGLSPRQRACVVLRFYEDLPVAEIADALGCGEGTVKRHLSDGLARLSTRLDLTQEGARP